MQAEHIGEVIEFLDEIISTSKSHDAAHGYFAALYKRVTVSVLRHIEEGDFFDDNARMEQLDVVFANRYFAAYHNQMQGGGEVSCWQVAFGASADSRVMVLQHLLLGMNAHIGFDLGMAAAQVAPGSQIRALESDFMRINQLLSAEVDTVQYLLARFTPFLPFVDWLGGRLDEGIAQFSMDIARDKSWSMATTLAGIDDKDLAAHYVRHRDLSVAAFSHRLHRPKVPFKWLVRFLSSWEKLTVRERISVLSAGSAER